MRRLAIVLAMVLVTGCCFTRNLLKDPEPEQQQFIRDEYGRICIYHGVNVSNFTKHSGELQHLNRGRADTAWCQPEDFRSLSVWGFNLIRHLWHWEAIEPNPGQFNKPYVQRKIQRVKWAGTYGTSVIVDLHQDLFCQKFCGNGFPEWTIHENVGEFGGCTEPWNLAYLDTVMIKSYHHFWNTDSLQDKYVALVDSVFSWVDTLPNVIGVDVMNEPIPDMSGKFEREKLTNLYTRIKQMHAARGYTKLIFFEPWMSTSAGIPTCLKFGGGPGTVYFPHYYDMFVDAGKPYGASNYALMKKAISIKVREAQMFGSPIMYGEFGATPNYTDYLGDLLNEFDKHRIGWTYYTYDLPQYSGYAFIDENKNLNATGNILVRIYPQKIAGNNPVYSVGPGVFSLAYDKIEIDQPTVIFIPEGLNISVQTTGQFEISGQYVLYHNTSEAKQSIRITW